MDHGNDHDMTMTHSVPVVLIGNFHAFPQSSGIYTSARQNYKIFSLKLNLKVFKNLFRVIDNLKYSQLGQ